MKSEVLMSFRVFHYSRSLTSHNSFYDNKASLTLRLMMMALTTRKAIRVENVLGSWMTVTRTRWHFWISFFFFLLGWLKNRTQDDVQVCVDEIISGKVLIVFEDNKFRVPRTCEAKCSKKLWIGRDMSLKFVCLAVVIKTIIMSVSSAVICRELQRRRMRCSVSSH